MNWAAIFWLVLMVMFLMVEASTVTLVSIWFSAGSLVAMIASFFGAPYWLQIVLCLGVAGLLLLGLRPFVRKYIRPKVTATNIDAIIGSTGYVTAEIDNLRACGQVKLGAMEWSARSVSGEIIPKGTLVKAERIEGVKVFVSEA